MRRALVIFVLSAGGVALGAERFPPPDFTDHKLPITQTPAPRAELLEWLDVCALAVALGAASYLAIRRRSRRGVFVLMLASLAYFGFYRQGCICAIGAIGNVTLAVFDASYAIPLTAVAFFALPLVATLFFGRTFCAAVCPLGAMQDLVLFKTVRIPRWLEAALGVLPYLYLGSAVLLAALGATFLICQYDPFVSFFRLSGSVNMLVLGVCVLAIGMFIGRPYCRFACPYGAILRSLSRLAKWHVSITPDECIRCRLCEDACPFCAIDKPSPSDGIPRWRGKWALAAMLTLLPALVAGGWFAGRQAGGPLARTHAAVRLADQLKLEESGSVNQSANTVQAFRKAGLPASELYAQADGLRGRFVAGAGLLGGFMGLVVGGRLIVLSVRRRRDDYLANRAACISCGRCFRFCPRERIRLSGGKLPKVEQA